MTRRELEKTCRALTEYFRENDLGCPESVWCDDLIRHAEEVQKALLELSDYMPEAGQLIGNALHQLSSADLKFAGREWADKVRAARVLCDLLPGAEVPRT